METIQKRLVFASALNIKGKKIPFTDSPSFFPFLLGRILFDECKVSASYLHSGLIVHD